MRKFDYRKECEEVSDALLFVAEGIILIGVFVLGGVML